MAGEILKQIDFAADPVQLQNVRKLVRAIGQQLQLHMTTIEEMVVGVNEACMNIIQHGYNNTGGNISLVIIMGDSEIIFRITDTAPTLDPSTLVSRSLDEVRPGGLGVHFINNMMDFVEYSSGDNNIGNVLELRKKINTKDVL